MGLWDVTTRQPLGDPLKGSSYAVASIAFSPGGKLLASASYDGTVRLWDAATRQPVGEPLKGSSYPFDSVAFSPDGQLLASAHQDQTVRLWDVTTRQPLGDPLELSYTVGFHSVAFSPGGKLLASANTDGTVGLWDMAPDSWVARLCRLADRNLTIAEWRQYIGPEVPYQRTCPNLPPGEGTPAK